MQFIACLKTLSTFVAVRAPQWHTTRTLEFRNFCRDPKNQTTNDRIETPEAGLRAFVRLRPVDHSSRVGAVRQIRSSRPIEPGNRLGNCSRQDLLWRT